jgi:hypothetical protein
MYGSIIRASMPTTLYSINISDEPYDLGSLPTLLKWNGHVDAKLAQTIVNGRRAINRGNLRRARYWNNCGERWVKKLP